jgi:glycosyltransferase involved in cell wall biosynthesis
MKIALVHDYIKEYGGAERVLEELVKLFPDAPIFTSLYCPEFLGPHRSRFEQYKIKTSFLQLIPFRHKLLSPLRLLSPLAFMSLDLSKFDVVIVSQTGAYFPNLVNKGSAKLICYTHTPPRYLYGYKTAREMKNPVVSAFAHIVFHFLRMVDFKASQNVDQFISNSEEVRARIQKFYRRDAIVIYPPVGIGSGTVQTKKENYYLAGGRLARAKGIDIIVSAFVKNRKKLKVFGKGFAGFDEELKSLASKNIEFVGEVTDVEKMKLMKNAKAYVFASYDEDFGITPVEAMSVGTPVIAYKSGGVKETIVDGKTGIFFEDNTPESLGNAIKKFESAKINSEACVKQAEQFSSEKFDKKIREIVRG